MFYDNYLRLKKLKDRLITQFEAEEQKINQDIFIRDIFIYPFEYAHSFGEARTHCNPYQEQKTITRLVDHIESLAIMANTYHEKYYCDTNADGTSTIKKDCLNKITRILLNEFSLYSSQPLSMNEFSQLMDATQEIAKQQHPNVHLLLSSFAVKTEGNVILNMSLYVQCGATPKIETFCKSSSSPVDITYDDTYIFSQKSNANTPYACSKYIAHRLGKTIPINTLFPVTTAGGAKYTQAVDVCLDHKLSRSKRLLGNFTRLNTHENIPKQVDQIVTSNPITLFNYASITESVAHIDPVYSRSQHMSNDRVETADFNKVKKNKYSHMSITQTSSGCIVQSPAFGSSFKMVATEERKLGGFSKQLELSVAHNNMQTKENIITAKLKNKSYEMMADKKHDIVFMLNQLFKQLLVTCEPSFLESLFKTKSYELKQEASELIKDFMTTLKNLTKDDMLIVYQAHVFLKDAKLKLAHINQKIPNELTKELTSTIDTYHHHIQPIQLALT